MNVPGGSEMLVQKLGNDIRIAPSDFTNPKQMHLKVIRKTWRKMVWGTQPKIIRLFEGCPVPPLVPPLRNELRLPCVPEHIVQMFYVV